MSEAWAYPLVNDHSRHVPVGPGPWPAAESANPAPYLHGLRVSWTKPRCRVVLMPKELCPKSKPKKILSLKWSEITRTQTRKFETTDDLGYLPMMEKGKKKCFFQLDTRKPRHHVQGWARGKSKFHHLRTRCLHETCESGLEMWGTPAHPTSWPLFFQKLMINHHQPSNVGAVGGSAWVSEKMLSLEVYVLWKLLIWRHWRVGFATGGLSPAFKVSLLVEVSGFGAHVLLPICSVCFARCFALLANRSIASSEIINLFKTSAY